LFLVADAVWQDTASVVSLTSYAATVDDRKDVNANP
jgi:hypothetical protein